MKYLLTYLLFAVSVFAQTTIKPLTQANIEAAITDDAGFQTAIGVDSALGLKVDTSLLSTTGGASKVLQTDASGNINISGQTLSGWSGADNGIFIGELNYFGMVKPDGTMMGRLYPWSGHDTQGGEVILESVHRIALAPGPNGAMQLGLSYSTASTQFAYFQARYTPTVGVPLGESLPVFWNAGTYGIDNADTTHVGIQGRATAAGDNELILFAGGSVPDGTGNDGTMPEIAAITVDGLRDPAGNSPPFVSLADAETITVSCSATKAFQNHYVTLSDSRTLAFSGLTAGMRGTIIVSQDSVGSRTLTLPDGSATQAAFALTTGTPYAVDVLSWFYNGTDIYWTAENDFVLPLDDDAAAFLTAASITAATTEGIAVNMLVKQLKSDGLWDDLIVEAWPLVGATSGKHAEGLKQAYDATFGAGVTHDADGITGNATSAGWMSTGINISSLGLRDDIGLYCYNKEATTTAGGRMFGCVSTANDRFYVAEASGVLYGSGPCSPDQNTCAATQSPNDQGHYWFGRTNSTSVTIRFNSTVQTATNAANTAPTHAPYFLALNSVGTAANATNANIAFAAVTKGLTAQQYADLTAAVDAFQTALGRAN